MRDLNIAYGNSCTAKKWSNKTIKFDELYERLKTTVRTSETVEEYKKMKKADRDSAKDKGGFVGGVLSEGRGKKDKVLSRSMFTGDVDQAAVDFIDSYEMLSPFKTIIYTTHSHTPEAPRLRLIIPFTRDVTPDEYQAIGRYFAAEWGIDQFDRCSYIPHQLMYWPTTPSNGEYICKYIDGEWLDPDKFLAAHPTWQDCATLPTSSRESEVRSLSGKKAEDPLEKKGIVGVFCRAYSISDAIGEFLSDVYEPAVSYTDRYSYIPADSSAGAIVYDNKFFYSHHASDPAADHLLNAFDLVRIHKFGDGDESFGKMCEFCTKLDKVKLKISEEKENAAQEDFAEGEDWRTGLQYQPRTGLLENSVWNLKLILENDPDYAGFGYNEMAHRVEVTGEVPWDRPENKGWRDADTAQLKASLDLKYTTFSSRNHDVVFTKVADDRRFHPIRNYLDSLPSWDGRKRVETILIDCLEAEDTQYTRTVTKKTFAAAVARIYHPGMKFDSVLVFDGEQGIGKSTLFKELAGEEYYSDTLSLTDMNDKSGAEKLQGFWVVEIAELAGMKKADIEKVKAFLSTSDDKYRPSYGHTVESHPRQGIIIASVNGERGYLRDITGNRRFWVVKLLRKGQKKEWKLDRDQIWAEAKAIWESGEKLYLEGDMVVRADEAQKGAMEEDERKGMVEEYLNTLLPAGWDGMDLFARRNYLSEKDAPTSAVGTVKRNEVSNLEIWSECFGRNSADMRPADSYSIAALMMQISGWERTNRSRKLAIYGKQRLYERVTEEQGTQEEKK